MMDVEKQSNGSDCGVVAIAYALNPCTLTVTPGNVT